VIDLLAQCEQKLMKLMEDLDGKDVSELYSGMEDEEVGTRRTIRFINIIQIVYSALSCRLPYTGYT
jgi:hypothetical protein